MIHATPRSLRPATLALIAAAGGRGPVGHADPHVGEALALLRDARDQPLQARDQRCHLRRGEHCSVADRLDEARGPLDRGDGQVGEAPGDAAEVLRRELLAQARVADEIGEGDSDVARAGQAADLALSFGHELAAHAVAQMRAYHFGGSDSDLDNDHYEGGASNLTVGGNAESAWNNGRASSSGHDDVIVYTGRNWTGRGLGQKGNLAGGLVNNVHSYRWVTPATCNRYKTALDLRRR